jgi:hypothetical protein
MVYTHTQRKRSGLNARGDQELRFVGETLLRLVARRESLRRKNLGENRRVCRFLGGFFFCFLRLFTVFCIFANLAPDYGPLVLVEKRLLGFGSFFISCFKWDIPS